MYNTLLEPITQDVAYTWLCKQRKHFPASSDVWHFRAHYPEQRPALVQSLANGSYRFAPMNQVRLKEKTVHVWPAQEALVLKMLSLSVFKHLDAAKEISLNAYHIQNNGGIKRAINRVQAKINDYPFVFNTDVKGFYENIQHDALMETLSTVIPDTRILDLIEQSVRRSVTGGGLYRDIKKGIPRGSSLSPLLGALVLRDLDIAMSRIKGIYYCRYMDDWTVLCPTRGKLRHVIKTTHKVLNRLALTLHPDKTYLGKTAKGFEFLGYHFMPKEEQTENESPPGQPPAPSSPTTDAPPQSKGGLQVAKPTMMRALTKLLQLYEQGKPIEACRLYWQRFTRWALSKIENKRAIFEQLSKIALLLYATKLQKEIRHEIFNRFNACG